MTQTLVEISELAESIGISNLTKGKVNLDKILKKNKIILVPGHYKNYFLGELVHTSRRFYIHLNLDQLHDAESTRARFTIAHELGHFFIENHKAKLKKGISLSEMSDNDGVVVKQIEREADHFASCLLMPRKHFLKKASRMNTDLTTMIGLSKQYDTSLESTALYYISLNIANCIMIKWNADYSYHYSSYSSSFSNLFKIFGRAPIKFDNNYIENLTIKMGQKNIEIFEREIQISNWIVLKNIRNNADLLYREQSIKLGEFGGITFLSILE